MVTKQQATSNNEESYIRKKDPSLRKKDLI